MTRPVRLVIFDCDGTLVDTQHAIVASMTRALADVGAAKPEPEAIRGLVGLSLMQCAQALLPEAESSQHEALVAAYRQAYFQIRKQPEFEQALYPGAREALVQLTDRGILLGVATGKSRRGLLASLDAHGLAPLFASLQTADDAPSKPHPGMLLSAMEETGSTPEESFMVGDTSFDMLAARNAKVAGVGVAWGYHAVEELHQAGADVVLDHFDQLMPWLSNGARS